MTKTLRYFFVLILGILLGYYVFRATFLQKNKSAESSALIVEKIEKVNKLITLESNLAEVYTIDESKRLFYDLIPIEKKALVTAKGRVFVSYNLEEMETNVDKENKIIYLTNIPAPQIIVEPKVRFYDLKANLIPFTENELSRINERATELLKKEAQKEELMILAKENLKANLSGILFFAESKGWTVKLED